MGEVSVIPQAWATRSPFFMKRSIIARGMAEPPQTTVLRCAGMSFPFASIYWSRLSQTVGTPAEVVTFSRSISSQSTEASLTAL